MTVEERFAAIEDRLAGCERGVSELTVLVRKLADSVGSLAVISKQSAQQGNHTAEPADGMSGRGA